MIRIPRRRLLLAVAGLALAACDGLPAPEADGIATDARAALEAHNREFERTIYPVGAGVHVAVGFGLANSILVEGDECVFVVDTLGSVEAARAVRAEFEKITDKPIAALIYTHNHADHVFGGPGFAPQGGVDVYAHETTEQIIDRVIGIIRPVIAARSTRMFGNLLPADGADAFVNAGIGPFLEIGRGGDTVGLLRPNRTFADRLDVEICGVQVQLVHAPGETSDQLFVWLPERRVLMPGDNVYKAFPNLYTIRGTPYRDVLEWSRSIDVMRALKPEHLAPSHTRPVSGAETIEGVLSAYRDAIQYVHDQTVRGMNLGLTPDELVAFVQLPPHLRDHPYLQEFYGTVEWSVRSIFDGYLGWFDGDAATLSPASPEERAEGFADLAGGQAALLAAARRALSEGHTRWGAELASELLVLDPGQDEARQLKARALRVLGQDSPSPNGRNFYLTQARELEGRVTVDAERELDESVLTLVRSIPIDNFMSAMPVNLDAQKAADTDLLVGFRFPDLDQAFGIHVRRGVAELQSGFPENADVSLTIDSRVWRELVVGARNPALVFASGDVQIEGSTLDLIGFLNLFN